MFLLKRANKIISHPLCKMINESFDSRSYPFKTKYADVVPIYIKGEKIALININQCRSYLLFLKLFKTFFVNTFYFFKTTKFYFKSVWLSPITKYNYSCGRVSEIYCWGFGCLRRQLVFFVTYLRFLILISFGRCSLYLVLKLCPV